MADSLAGTNCAGNIIDGGHNISSDASCLLTAPGSLNSTNPRLGPLADYGGLTPTLALLSGSPAFDAANPAFALPNDQRGRSRPYGPGSDIGAFESSPPYTVQGWITGCQPPPSSLLVTAGAISNVVGTNGNYFLPGFEPGTYMVRPQAAEAVFVLSNQVVTLGPDTIVNFYSYRSNALTLERSGLGMLRAVFAGSTGDTWHVMCSTNLPTWMPYSTNTVEASGLFDLTLPSADSPRFFRTERP